MLKVRFETITIQVPVIDNSGEHDAKMHDSDYQSIHYALDILRSAGFNRQAMPQQAPPHTAFLLEPGQSIGPGSIHYVGSGAHVAYPIAHDPRPKQPPASQVDPPIDTRVRDSEMRSSEPDMTLEEFNERPERTRAAPRPRANSWRHGNG